MIFSLRSKEAIGFLAQNEKVQVIVLCRSHGATPIEVKRIEVKRIETERIETERIETEHIEAGRKVMQGDATYHRNAL